MRLALTQLMQSFHYGQRTLFRRLFSPVIDKLMFAATKADHVTIDQHANMVSLLQQLIQDAWQNAGVRRDQHGLPGAGVSSGDHPAALLMLTVRKSRRCVVIDLAMAHRSLVYPGEVPARLPGQAFWDKQGFQFEAFRPQVMDVDKPLPHIRLDAALEL